MKVLGILLCCLGAAIILFLLVSAIAAAINGLLSAIGQAKTAAGGVLGPR